MSKQSRHLYILGVFIVINIALIGLNIFLVRQKKNESNKLLGLNKSNEPSYFYEYSKKESINLDCPELAMNSIEGNRIELRNYAGSVLIIQFSRFYREDLPNLLLCIMTVANLVYSTWPCEAAGPTFRCEREARLYCAAFCGGQGHCQYYGWSQNHCEYSVCYETWGVLCTDGSYSLTDCASLAGPCPKKL
jgi:hypothetical protein